MDGLPLLWREHQGSPFPYSCLKLALSDVPLVKLDAEAGASLTASLRMDGVPRALPADRRASLFRCCGALEEALLRLDLDAEARGYFERVLTLAVAVLAVRE